MAILTRRRLHALAVLRSPDVPEEFQLPISWLSCWPSCDEGSPGLWRRCVMLVSSRALGMAVGLIWGGAILVVGLIHGLGSSYGTAFLQGISSLYPGFHASGGLADAAVGTLYGLVDGAVGGFILGWLYNCFLGRHGRA